MPSHFRKVFFYLYLLLFVIAAPVVVLYTAGYRFDFITHRFTVTGAINVGSIPKGAQVTLDGTDTNRSTPTFLSRVSPGTYHLELTKDGYHPWARDVEVTSRQTTSINNAVLFVDTQPTSVFPISAAVTAVSPDGDQFAYGVSAAPWFELWIYTISTKSYVLLDRETIGTTPTLVWSADGQQLIMGSHLFSLTGPLPDGTTPHPPMLDPTYRVEVKPSIWHLVGGQLFYTDGLEAHRYNISDNTDALLTRSSVPLTDVVPFPNSSTVFFVTKKEVTASDLSDPAQPIDTQILSADDITNFWTDNQGQNAYFYGTVNGQTGLFTLPLTQ